MIELHVDDMDALVSETHGARATQLPKNPLNLAPRSA